MCAPRKKSSYLFLGAERIFKMNKRKRSTEKVVNSRTQPSQIEQLHLMVRQMIDVMAGECLGGDSELCSLEALQMRSKMRRALDVIGTSIDLLIDTAKGGRHV